jgi:predicted MFS family arabinose efflux permease
MTAFAASADLPFVRTRVTWLGYAFLAYFSLALSFLGPTMPFIAAKLDMTFTEISYFFTMGAVGGLLSSLTGDRIVRRLGNTRVIWSAAILTVLALFGITLGTTLTTALFGSFLYGFGIGLVAMVTITALSVTNPAHASKAIAEGNIGGGITMIIGPILVGLIAQSALGWQAIAFLLPLVLAFLAIILRGTVLPSVQRESPSRSSDSAQNVPLPLMFWVFGAMMFLVVALEWLISSWGASFLTTVVGYVPSTAAALVSVFAVAIVLGRLIGRRLLDFMSETRLLILSLVWVLLVFPIYWLSTLPILNVAGLFLIGLGIGNLAPLTISGAMAAAGGATGRASARIVLFPNLANLTLIPLVGVLADGIGIQRAYVVVIVVALVAIVLASNTHRIRRAAA